MAEIPIQRKEGRNIWPWLIGLLVLLLILWFLFGRNRAARTAAVPDTTSAVAAAATSPATSATNTTSAGGTTAGAAAASGAGAAGAVATFATYVGTTDPNRDEAKQHGYTAQGIRHLADALVALGASGAGLDTMRSMADSLQNSSPKSTRHADMAREAFLAATSVMASLQTQHFPNMAKGVADARQAAQAVKPGTQLLDQKDRIQAFFERSRDALQAMTRTAS